MKWHNPGLGEVHNEDHSQMIYCENADGIVDDGLAKEVCDLLNSKVKPAVEPVAWKWRRYAVERWTCTGFWDSIEAMAAQEMEQRGWEVIRLYAAPTTKAEPAPGLAIPDDCPHLILYDDADRRHEVFAGHGSEAMSNPESLADTAVDVIAAVRAMADGVGDPT